MTNLPGSIDNLESDFKFSSSCVGLPQRESGRSAVRGSPCVGLAQSEEGCQGPRPPQVLSWLVAAPQSLLGCKVVICVLLENVLSRFQIFKYCHQRVVSLVTCRLWGGVWA